MVSALAPIPRIAAELEAWQPRIVAAYPTAALALAEEQVRGRLHLALRELWTGGESLCGADRTHLEQVFGCRVRNDYGASEFMNIGWECPHGHMHYNADWVVLEPVDRAMRPVPPGVPSHTVLLTNLANRVQPLLRYDLGDSVTLLEGECACGAPFPRLRVQGRCDDVLVLPCHEGGTARLLPLALATVIEEQAALYDFQLVLVTPRRLALRAPHAGTATARRAVRALDAYLAGQGVTGVSVVLDRHAPRRDAASGKLRRVVDAIGSAPALRRGASR